MSLRSVHLFFIIASAVLSLLMGVWAANAYRSGFESLNYLVTAAVSLLVAGILSRYAVSFARRARRIGLD